MICSGERVLLSRVAGPVWEGCSPSPTFTCVGTMCVPCSVLEQTRMGSGVGSKGGGNAITGAKEGDCLQNLKIDGLF